MTRIISCDCKHEFQDKRYGVGKRVFNSKKDSNDYVCTVCRATKIAKGE